MDDKMWLGKVHVVEWLRHGNDTGTFPQFALRKGPRPRSYAFALALMLTVVNLVPVRGADPPPLTRLLARAGDYVRRFEQDFALVVSDEDYRQHARGPSNIAPLHRRTRAEMLFMWLPDEAVWLTVRNVLTADGHPVPGSRAA
jgi:hypothetical protein